MQRLSDDTLLFLLRDLESDRVERKESFKGDVPKKARQAVCAFANDLPSHNAPGVLLIGARDDGTASGIEISDQLLLALADMKTDGNILPLPVLSVEKRVLDGATLAVVTVQPSDMPPVKYDGRIWIRTGPRRAIANAQEERILTDPIIDEARIGGALVEMLRQTEEKLKAHNRIAFDILSGPTHRKDSPYPQAALQQILYNAVLHRTYEGTNAPIRVYWFNDRIEIHSPGGPYGNVTPENFGRPGITDYRNPNMADALKVYGFIQAFGRGIAIARQEMSKNGNPPPEFDISPSMVACILPGKQNS